LACRGDPRIVGILFHVITPAHIQDVNLLTTAQYAVVICLPERSPEEVNILHRFATVISDSFDATSVD
jgi:hypothetical protein